MDNNRGSQRKNVVRAGTISFDGSGIDCLVRNMSVGGANLEVESQIGNEPPRDCRRLVGLSYAAMAGCSSMA
jgi:hypothetical protein